MLLPLSFHWYDNPVPVLAFNTTEEPLQKVVVDAGVMVAVGAVVLDVIFIVAVAVHPLLPVTVTL